MTRPRALLAVPFLFCCALSAGAVSVHSGEVEGAAREVAVVVSAGDAALAAWGRVLRDHVREGGVDYAGLKASPEDLETYLASLAAARPERLGPDDALAFWSNAYNAVVLRHVLDRYPGIESVKEEAGFFDRLTFPVAGADRTLDEIESEGRKLGDPRIHFAVVCASTSCPDLPDEPFRGAVIDQQLHRVTAAFLADPDKGMRYEPDSGTLWLSSIFKWYAGDFTGGSTVVAFFARGGVADWVRAQLPPEVAGEIGDSATVRYLEYDWGLNDRPVSGR